MRGMTTSRARQAPPVDRQERDRRRQEGLCVTCGERILGRDSRASTCLLHRAYGGPPTRAELIRLIAEYETLIESIRFALVEMDGLATP